MMPALRCACALALVCLVVLLLRPKGALAKDLQLQQPRGPRAAGWLTTLGQWNKYIEKFFNSSLKPKDTKKSKDVKKSKKTSHNTKTPPSNATKSLPANAAKSPPVNATIYPPRDPTNTPLRNTAERATNLFLGPQMGDLDTAGTSQGPQT